MSAKSLLDVLLRRVTNLEEAAHRSGYKPRPITLTEELPLPDRMKLISKLHETRSLLATGKESYQASVQKIDKEIAAAHLTIATLQRSLQGEHDRFWGGPREKQQAAETEISQELYAGRLAVLDDILTRLAAAREATLDASARLLPFVRAVSNHVFVGSIRWKGTFVVNPQAEIHTRLHSALRTRREMLESLAEEVASWHELPLDASGYLALIESKLAPLPPIPEELKDAPARWEDLDGRARRFFERLSDEPRDRA